MSLEPLQTNDPDSLSPTRQRIESLDLIRGVALLGILIVNIQAMAMIGSAYSNPQAFGDFAGSNFWVWWITEVFFESKMMAIFSMLFGAGIILLTDRVKDRGASPFWIHGRRMLWLLLFGILHAHLIWFGDILYSYAICGFTVFFFRKMSPRTLLALGICSATVPFVFNVGVGASMGFMPQGTIENFRESWLPSSERVAAEVDAYRGSWFDQFKQRSSMATTMQTFVFGIILFWRASGMMLIGMALFKLGYLTNQRSLQEYRRTILICLSVGFTLALFGVQKNIAEQFRMEYSMFFGPLPNYVGSVFVAVGYIGVLSLWQRTRFLSGLQYALRAVGRMALTNYLMQSVLATTIFYGFGLGWFGQVSRTEQLGIVAGIWVLQLVWSPVWLHYFRFGPFEWLWRSLTYVRIQPWR
ncbi:MAG TPA: DUF418 domain-containing protein [Pirellulaceae bacterium]|nr:DUF418 domain-containing protein [Pirellulaceae bacterium]HMO91178.1 DUF418 domain-containing protein [Pirellulaceae bacterium]HMP69052.1 DUF418 domain-containing protein [Pirellulaceae bacterium]